MTGNPITVHTIVIPSDNPVFLALIAIHVIAALSCVVSGIVAMLAKKQRGLHSKAGTVYFFALIIVLITVTIISAIRWKEDYHLFILGVVSFGSAFIARTAIRRKWNKWQAYHITGMGLSYIILVTAFYVDNGKFLPVWKDLPPIVYWTLPAIVGIPIIIYALLRHPIMKK
jgi:uncharacterized membrane protein